MAVRRLALAALACIASFAMVADAFKCLIQVNITMRDGIALHTCIDFPLVQQPAGGFDLVMDRSPYGESRTEEIADLFLLENYVAIRQDQRGTQMSGGHFTMWANAANDSYDTMQYLAQQPWASGTMFTVGASADGMAVFAQPKLSPPWLKGSTMIFTTDSGYDIIFPGGAFRQSLTEFWLNKTVPRDYPQLIKQVLANEAPGPWWDRLNASLSYQNVNFPTVSWGGWYDIFLVGQLEGYYLYQNLSPSAGKHFLVVDPLGHCQHASTYFPYHTIDGRVALPLLLALEVFKPSGTIPEGVKAVTFYVMGSHGENETAPGNYWTSLQEFPQPTLTNYYLFDGPNPAIGVLTPSQPQAPAPMSRSYVYDPTNPVPSTGGNNLEIPCGPLDQRPIESRPDVLLFETDVLTSPLALTGPLSVTLWVASNATDTDFTAKLTDVYPSGESALLQDGIIRMRWRDLPYATQPSPIEPGVPYQVTLNLWNTSFVFNAGHRLRLAISSSNYPRFSVNPNNMDPLNTTTPSAPVVALNTVIYGTQKMASYVTLPVVSLEDMPPVSVTDIVDKWLAQKTPEQRIAFEAMYQRRLKEAISV